MTQRKTIDSVLALLVAVGIALAPIPAAAQSGSYEENRDHLGWAKVVSATAVYETIRIVTPETRCWTEHVVYEHRDENVSSPVPMILGATVGGLLGRGIGHRGSRKRAGTVVGAILGGTIGHEIERGNRKRRSHAHREYRDEERCETTDKVTWEEELRGYDVVYRYNGREYETHMTEAPADRIRVIIDVVPAQ